MIWITIIWLYVLPLIADHGLSFMEAAGRSRGMVRDAGWWWTFGMVILLWLAAVILLAIVVALSVLFGKADSTVGVIVGILLFLVFAVLFPPYAICYVSVLYVGSGGDLVTVPAGGGMGIPPAPPAPPSYGGGQTLGTPPTYSMPPGAPASADAWKAAADPLASAPPPPPLAPAAGAGAGCVPGGRRDGRHAGAAGEWRCRGGARHAGAAGPTRAAHDLIPAAARRERAAADGHRDPWPGTRERPRPRVFVRDVLRQSHDDGRRIRARRRVDSPDERIRSWIGACSAIPNLSGAGRILGRAP